MTEEEGHSDLEISIEAGMEFAHFARLEPVIQLAGEFQSLPECAWDTASVRVLEMEWVQCFYLEIRSESDKGSGHPAMLGLVSQWRREWA
jgi:hypothetical protein